MCTVIFFFFYSRLFDVCVPLFAAQFDSSRIVCIPVRKMMMSKNIFVISIMTTTMTMMMVVVSFLFLVSWMVGCWRQKCGVKQQANE